MANNGWTWSAPHNDWYRPELQSNGTWSYIFSKDENSYASAGGSHSQIIPTNPRGGSDDEEEEEQPLEPGRQPLVAVADVVSGMSSLAVSDQSQGTGRTRLPLQQTQGLNPNNAAQQTFGYSTAPAYTSQSAGFSNYQTATQLVQGYGPQTGYLATPQTSQPYGNSAGGPERVLSVADEVSTIDGQPIEMLRGTQGTFEELDPDFKKVKDHWKFYVPGRVFKTLWWEPMGEQDLEQAQHGPSVVRYGEEAYAKVRRFIVVRAKPKEYYSKCIRISTHGGRGATRKGLNQEEHCIVYTGKNPPNKLTGESKMWKEPIHVKAISQSEKLDPLSRVNLAKTYPVEHNIKIKEIGMVSSSDLKRLIGYWNNLAQK